jgi:ketol-acid reductoisomerase
MKSNYSNTAQLKDLMTVPPMTAEQHAEVMRKRIQSRRMLEEAKELRKAERWQFDKR